MATEPAAHPTITEDQIEIWENSPVTKALIKALEWSALDVAEMVGKGQRGIDSDNADRTHAEVHLALGEQVGLRRAAYNYRDILEEFNLIYHPAEEPDGNP